jgi:hypothetical protein
MAEPPEAAAGVTAAADGAVVELSNDDIIISEETVGVARQDHHKSNDDTERLKAMLKDTYADGSYLMSELINGEMIKAVVIPPGPMIL